MFNWDEFFRGFYSGGIVFLGLGLLILVALVVVMMPGNVPSNEAERLRRERDAAKERVDALRRLRERAEGSTDASLEAEVNSVLSGQ